MKKMSTPFTFSYPLKQQRVRDLKIVTEHLGDLEVEAVGYFDPSASVLDIFERFAADLETVKWQGTDIKPVLLATGFLEEVEEAAIRHFAQQLEHHLGRAA